jgi:hypothetical protein
MNINLKSFLILSILYILLANSNITNISIQYFKGVNYENEMAY